MFITVISAGVFHFWFSVFMLTNFLNFAPTRLPLWFKNENCRRLLSELSVKK